MNRVIIVSSVMTGFIALIACYGLFIYLEKDGFSYQDATKFILFEPLLLCVVMPTISTSIYLTQSLTFKAKRKIVHAFFLTMGCFSVFYFLDFIVFLLLPEYAVSFQTSFNDFISQKGGLPSTKKLPIGYQCIFVNILPLVFSLLYCSLAIRLFREKSK